MSKRLAILLAVVAAALVVAVGPVAATEAPAADQSPAGEAPAAEGEGGEGRTKIEPPLSFEDPQDVFGWILLALVAVGGGLATVNLVKQLRGERAQADGSWRPR